ncbi:MAG TPA: glutathione S-transferase family protein [Candidatus Polarisedimenticolaceae bacterium]|nr:glutathione S-transferase family protein [Candidatus Polarisedimenticolaceae bacterium]
MGEWVLYLGNRNYSSWSMRAWLAMKQAGFEFDEVRFHLGQPDVRQRIAQVSPTGRVPALHHRGRAIWDSLAIGEYLAERAPDAGLWPRAAEPRAVARSVVAEMHAGFPGLRSRMPFNVRRSSPGVGREAEVEAEIDRVFAIWRTCREDFGGDGEFLFGAFGLADAFYAPVVSRFKTYAVTIERDCRAYVDAVWQQPWVRQWRAEAEAEEWVEPRFDL